jgi:hypothetical protein
MKFTFASLATALFVLQVAANAVPAAAAVPAILERSPLADDQYDYKKDDYKKDDYKKDDYKKDDYKKDDYKHCPAHTVTVTETKYIKKHPQTVYKTVYKKYTKTETQYKTRWIKKPAKTVTETKYIKKPYYKTVYKCNKKDGHDHY